MTSPYGTKKDEDEAQPGAALAPNPDQVNEFHRYDDSDNAPESHHHTLGVDPNQASPGDHNHNGQNSFLIGEGSIPDQIGNWGQQKGHGAFSGIGANEGFNDPDMTFGADYVQGTSNGPPGANTDFPFLIANTSQYYNQNQALGVEYPISQYVKQTAIARVPLGGIVALWHRFREGGAWGSWMTSSPVLLFHCGSAGGSFVARSNRTRIQISAEWTNSQSGQFTVTINGQTSMVSGSNVMNLGGNGSVAGRPVNGSRITYINTTPGSTITITVGGFAGTTNVIDIFAEACS